MEKEITALAREYNVNIYHRKEDDAIMVVKIREGVTRKTVYPKTTEGDILTRIKNILIKEGK